MLFLKNSYVILKTIPTFVNKVLCHLLGISSGSQLKLNRLKGNVFENMVVAEFHKANQHLYLHQQYYFWQDSNANEIDILQKTADSFRAYEVKATQTVSRDLFKGLDRFADAAAPINVMKTLVYGGNEDQQRTNYTVQVGKISVQLGCLGNGKSYRQLLAHDARDIVAIEKILIWINGWM